MLLLFFGGFQGEVGPLDPEPLGSNAGGIEDVSHMWIALKKALLEKGFQSVSHDDMSFHQISKSPCCRW